MNKKAYLLHLLLVVILVFAFSASALAATYSDTPGHWAESSIETWSGHGVIIGSDGKFRPNDSITRAEMAIIIHRIMQYDQSAANTFADVDSTSWYTEAVLKANAAGVILGYDNLLRPQDTISREEAIVMMARALGLDRLTASAVLPYADSAAIADWAANEVGVMQEQGYLNWCGGSFAPRQAITRAEIIATLDNTIRKMWRGDGLYTNVIEGSTVISTNKAYLLNSHFNGNIIIGGCAKTVVFDNCTINGEIINLNNAEISVLNPNLGEVNTFYFGRYDMPIDFSVAKNTYAAVNFVDQNGRKIYADANVPTRAGIDVSQWQKDISWSSVAADGIEFAFVRLGYRGYTEGKISLDEKYHQNMAGALNAGLDVGVYFFSQAISTAEAVEEANMCIAYLRDYDISYPVVFDWETVGAADARTNNINGNLLTDCMIAFCDTIKAAGYEPMIYANKELSLTTLKLGRLTQYPFWFAGYTTYPEFYYGFDIWQYTSSGSVAGIEGRVDMNIEFLD